MGAHYYSFEKEPRNGYGNEGVELVVLATEQPGTSSIWAYSTTTSSFYTDSIEEGEAMLPYGYEKIGNDPMFYVFKEQPPANTSEYTIPLYRWHRERDNDYVFFTSDKDDRMSAAGWTCQRLLGYAYWRNAAVTKDRKQMYKFYTPETS